MKLDLYGWFPEDNKKVLSNLIKELDVKTVLEIGCFLGKSTNFFVEQGCTVTSVDTFAGASDLNRCKEVEKRLPNLYEQFLFNLKALNIQDKVTVFKGTSEDAFYSDIRKDFDLVFIDGSHEYDDVVKDISLWGTMAIKVLCGDDYNDIHPGVKKAVDELLPNANKDHRCWYLIK